MRSSTSVSWALSWCVVSLSHSSAPQSAFGQGFATGEFNGSVVDKSGARASRCNDHPHRGIDRSRADGRLERAGRFVLPAMQPGVYTVRAELSGFQTQARTGIRILVGQAVTLTLHDAHRDADRSNHGDRGSPLIEVTQTTLGSSLTTEDIENLPTQGREMLSLMQMIPGVTPQLDAGNFEGTTYSANGRESQSNLFLVDGVHNKDDRGGAFTQVSDDHRRLLRVQRDDARLRGGIRRGLRRHRQRGHQERDESVSWQRVLLRSGRPLQRHQLLHEAGRPGRSRRAATTSWARASAGQSSGTRRSSFSTPSDSGSRTRST